MRASTLVPLLMLSLPIYTHASTTHHGSSCVFGFATCGNITGPDGSIVPVPCKYDGPPKVISDKNLLARFDELCPSLNVLETPNPLLCCSEEQILQFIGSIQKAKAILGSCPSCFINFSQLFCDLTCNPRQASFAKVTQTSPYKDSLYSVDAINYTIPTAFVEGLYNSCKDVIWSQIQGKAISVLCGDTCSPKELVEFVGQKGNAPFQITYNYTQELRVNAISCNTSVGEQYPRLKHLYKSRCSFVDCPADPQPIPQPDTPWIIKIGGVYVLVTFLFIILAALISVVYDHYGDYDHCIIDTILNRMFKKWALFCTQYATLVILLGIACVTLSCVGLTKLQVLTDPVNLWSQTNSQAHQEKIYYETAFTPFYRVEQIIIYPASGSKPWLPYNGDKSKTFSNVFQLDFIESVLKLQETILNLQAHIDDKLAVKITDICVQPLSNNICSVMSPLDWFQGNEKNFHLGASSSFANSSQSIDKLNDKNLNSSLVNLSNRTIHQPEYLTHFMSCFKNSLQPQDKEYYDLPCLGPYGGPIYPHIGLAGYSGHSYWEANSLVITIPVKNNKSHKHLTMAKAWEKEFINVLSNYDDPKLKLAFFSERSIEDEIVRQSQSDIFTIAISYLVMFAYVAISLGRSTNLKSFLIDSRIVLGLGGVLIVLASVLASIGILSFFGVRATLIIIEVIPFLVLAVGVDNIFIIVQALQRVNHNPSQLDRNVEERISTVIGDVAPSLLLASLSESACFLIGTLTPMPAVRVFAMTASLALLVDFVLQMTVFIGLLTLDTKRQLSGRYDLFCCLTASKISQSSLMASSDHPSIYDHPRTTNALHSNDDNATPMGNPNLESIERYASDDTAKFIMPSTGPDPLYRLFENHLAPALMKPLVRLIAMVIFFSWLCLSLAVINQIDVGLDQTMSVPDDSYMQDYFNAQRNDLRVGPPVYFVLKRGLNFSDEFERSAVCSSDGCLPFSLVSHISRASLNSNATYIATPSNSWVDDYKTWGANDYCCRMFKSYKKFDNSSQEVNLKSTKTYSQQLINSDFCPYNTPDIKNKCQACDLVDRTDNRFNTKVFYDYVDNFRSDTPRTECVSGGSAVYSDLIKLHQDDLTIDSAFSSYHTPLKDSKDFIESMKSARSIAQNIEEMLNQNLRSTSSSSERLEVFPYCFTYVFYEQYLTIWQQTFRNLSISMVTIFVVTYLLLGCDLYISVVVVGTLASIIIDLMGLMYFWDIQLNAISLVNLVMAVGISVEFCSHVARAFALSQRPKPVDRAQDALIKMGSSVLSGITLTKIAGISILAFAKSRIFKVYYFRMYMGIVLVGAAHGIIFMPIILSLTARERKSNQEGEEQNQQIQQSGSV